MKLPRWDRPSNRIALAVLLALVIILLATFVSVEFKWTNGRLGVPLDDAWIHYQFARNLGLGHGFSFNPGEPTPGSTAPLWSLLLAAFGFLSQEFLTISVILSAVFLLATVVLTYNVTTDLTGSARLALMAGLGVALTGRLLWAGLAGMETTAFAAASLGAVWLHAKRGLRPLPTLLFALASQLRPEGHLLFALALLDASWDYYHDDLQRLAARRRPIDYLQRFAPSLLVYLLISLPYAAFSLAVTGKPFPNTFYAKASTEQIFSTRTLAETLQYHWQDNWMALLLVIPGVIPAWRRCRLAVAWLVVLPLTSALTIDLVWHHGRYTLPLIPFVMIVAAFGAGRLLEQVPTRVRTTASAIALLLFAVAGVWLLPFWASQLGKNAREILVIDVAIGEWLAEHTPADSVIAVDDIGAIGYLSGRRIFDMNGLVSPEMWPAIRGEPLGRSRSEAAARILSEVQPDYMAIFPLWHWELATNPQVAEAIAEFRVDTNTIIGEQQAVVYRTQWPYLQAEGFGDEPVGQLGEGVQLLDFDLAPADDSDSRIGLTLFWRSVAPVSSSYYVFVHILNEKGEIVVQADREPVHFLAPTNRWQPGDIIRDIYWLDLPAGPPVASYTVQVGMYDRASGGRLPASLGVSTNDAIFLTRFDWPQNGG